MGRSIRILVAAAVLGLSFAASADAEQPSVGDLLQPFPDNTSLEASADSMLQAAGHTEGSNQSLRLSTYEARARYQLINTYPVNPTIGFNAFHLDIASAEPRLPQHLTDLSVGFASPLSRLGEDWFLAAGAGVGYAGNSLFNEGDAYYGMGVVLVGRQIGESSALVFSLEYNGNRVYYPDIPIPSVTYSTEIDKTLSLTVGIAFLTLEWKPTDRLEISLNYQAPESLVAEVQYSLFGGLKAYAAARSIEEGFHSDELAHRRRILFYQRRVEAGLRWRTAPGVDLVAGIGYAFDTRFEAGFDDRTTRLIDRSNDAGYLRFGLSIQF